jgi:hypothetical protein
VSTGPAASQRSDRGEHYDGTESDPPLVVARRQEFNVWSSGSHLFPVTRTGID